MLHKGLASCSAALLLTLTGCATGPSTVASSSVAQPRANSEPVVVGKQKVKVFDKAQAGEQDVRCRSFQPTGSHRIITRCTTGEQRELEEDAARNTLQGQQRPAGLSGRD